jgi:serine/threonine protein kinase
VIQSLVQNLTKRSPFLQDADIENSDMLMLDRLEVQVGELLGHGNFSNVFEVVGFHLQNQTPQHGCLESLKQQSGSSTAKVQEQGPPDLVELSDEEDPSSDKSSTICQRGKLAQTSVSSQQDGNKAKPVEEQRLLFASTPQPDIQSKYALKCLRPELLAKPKPKIFLEAAADLVIEAQYLSKLNHPNILKARGLASGWETAFANGEYDSFFLLVDRLEETLNQRIKRWRRGELSDRNTIDNKCSIALQIASALNYLHERNLIFRDLKVGDVSKQS